VDLISLLESLHLPVADASLLTETLAAYELDLDRALLDKERVLKEDEPFKMYNEYSAPKIMKQTTRIRENGLIIRDLNDRFARQIEAALPEERRAGFRTAFHAAAFPAVYSQNPGSRLLAAALNLPDLDTAQREAIGALRAHFERDLATANFKLEGAIRDLETAKKSVTMPIESGGSIQVLLGAIDQNPVLKARKEKESLAIQLRDRIEKLLRPAQVDVLPDLKQGEPDEQLGMDDTGVIIHRGG
jgi:hypothetical protein